MKLDAIRVAERIAVVMADTGFPRMPARVLAALMCAPGPGLTAVELTTALRISRAAVSMAVKYLVQVGFVTRMREPHARIDRYRMESDVWFESFAERDRSMLRWSAALQEGAADLGLGSRAGQRLDESYRFFIFLRGELARTMQKWRRLSRKKH